MITFEAVCHLVSDLDPGELEQWIAERWVLPESGGGGYLFHEVDVARIRLIHEMRRELAIDAEAMPVVLGLLDQLYTLRRGLRRFHAAIEALPEETRAALLARLGASPGDE